MEFIFGTLMGIGLSAACGFRVFVPFLVMSFSAKMSYVKLTPGFEWIASDPALACFLIATIAEISAYYVPFVDNALDTAAAPVAVVAGIILTASAVGDISPFLKWTLAIIAGGGAAATVQGLTTVTRLTSSVATAGTGNPAVSTAEAAGSLTLSLVAIFLPVIAFVIFIVLIIYFIRKKTKVIPAAIPAEKQ
ncbi:MAG: hypothetical protein A2008_14160 [Candidatus Wallbacteria bacterium GWC2_49_35]|uniref:DUF4126 domain-containing protein n=1 Tax=Candidatus Wallbacteria bacterium GWC2_49_35 TaxID=1817813 RepID=A0A1F7X278_9BACT|nr:MAG: hypothetical protein A2008_14160 [Candidatus Wallbacteria bacterium GWC2_49_35]HBC75581.1 DUF4126 domain-containing protein [Candidatus Wallbacteria bacterium]